MYCNPVFGATVSFATDSASALFDKPGGAPAATLMMLTSSNGTAQATIIDQIADTVQLYVGVDVASQANAPMAGSPATIVFLGPIPPAPPVITWPLTGSVTGNPTLPISGTSTAIGATITVTDLGGTPVCTATVDPSGNWTCQPAVALSLGQHTLTAVATTSPVAFSTPSNSVIITVGSLSLEIQKPVVRVGDSQVVIGYGFEPGELVHLTLKSATLDGGYAPANEDGTVAFLFVVPTNQEAGWYDVTLTGELSGSITGQFQVLGLGAATGGYVQPPLSGWLPEGLICLIGAMALSMLASRVRQIRHQAE